MEEQKDIENSVEKETNIQQEELLPNKEINESVESVETKEIKEIKETDKTSLTTTENIENIENNTEEIEEKNDTSDVFITESDTFDIRISYYKTEGDFCVEGVDDEFDPKNTAVKHVDITFKYPSQGDYETILAQNAYKTPDKMTLIDVLQMELTRLVVLIRKWSLKAEFSRMVELDTKIVKAISNKVREKIGIRGIM